MSDIFDAIEEGEIEKVEQLLRDAPSLIHTRDSFFKNQPIHVACRCKQVQIIGVLAAYMPDVNSRGDHGWTALHCAVCEGGPISTPIVASLISMGADPQLKDDNGFTPADWAKIEIHEGLADVLRALKGEFNIEVQWSQDHSDKAKESSIDSGVATAPIGFDAQTRMAIQMFWMHESKRGRDAQSVAAEMRSMLRELVDEFEGDPDNFGTIYMNLPSCLPLRSSRLCG